MRIEIPYPQPRKDGDYRFYVNPAYGEPTGTIWLGEGHALTLSYVTAEDCDRLIRAAAEVKQKVMAYTAEMSAPHGRKNIYQGDCQLCGKPEDDELHADPAPATLVVSTKPEAAPKCRACENEPATEDGFCEACAPAALLAAAIASGAPLLATGANPPYHMTGNMVGPCCLAEDGGYICNSQEGHDGPAHVAYDGKDHECRRWPVDPAPDDGIWVPLAGGACGHGTDELGEGIACGAPAGHLRRHEREAVTGGWAYWRNEADPETGEEEQPKAAVDEAAASVTA
jgi:hypothetical protein